MSQSGLLWSALVVGNVLWVVAVLVVALRSRSALRAAWAAIEDLKRSVTDLSNRTTGRVLELESEIASLVHGRPLRFTSQGGEDVWLWNRFARKESGVYVEVGAFNGIDASNSWFFEQLGWTGVLVEPDPVQAEHCTRNRPASTTVQAAAGREPGTLVLHRFTAAADWSGMLSHVGESDAHSERLASMTGATETVEVPCVRLDDVLGEAGIDRIDFVSIDVEGAEESVLAGFDLDRWRPEVIVLERTYEGKRASPLAEIMTRAGYRRETTIGANDVYTRS